MISKFRSASPIYQLLVAHFVEIVIRLRVLITHMGAIPMAPDFKGVMGDSAIRSLNLEGLTGSFVCVREAINGDGFCVVYFQGFLRH